MSEFARSKRTGSVKVVVIAGIAVVVFLGAFTSAYLYTKHKFEGKPLSAMNEDNPFSNQETPVTATVDEEKKDSETVDENKDAVSTDNTSSEETTTTSGGANTTANNSTSARPSGNIGSSSTSTGKVTNINDKQVIASQGSHQSHNSNNTTHNKKPQPVGQGSNSIKYEYAEPSKQNINNDYIVSNSASNTTTSDSSTGATESSKPSNSGSSADNSKPVEKPEKPQDDNSQSEKAIFCEQEVKEFWEQLNAYRQSRNLKALKWNDTIANVAGVHAKKGAIDGFIKHNSDYPGQALLRTNLYDRPMTGEQLITPLKNSDFHSKILLSANATEGAVSIYRQPDYTYFVVVDMNA